MASFGGWFAKIFEVTNVTVLSGSFQPSVPFSSIQFLPPKSLLAFEVLDGPPGAGHPAELNTK